MDKNYSSLIWDSIEFFNGLSYSPTWIPLLLDFLTHFNLLPDIRHKRLIDGNTFLKVSAQFVNKASPRLIALAEVGCP